MELLHFLREKLRLIQNLYDSTAPIFEERKRQAGVDEALLADWEGADDSLTVIGHWCLCMVQGSLKTYLRDCISPLGSIWWNSKKLQERLTQKEGKKNWFKRYKLLFLDLGIDWEKGPVDLSDLEQLNLTRDDLIHNTQMLSFSVERSKSHAERFPASLFTDDLWAGERLRIDRTKLTVAIMLVTSFCEWLDGIRCRYPQYIKAVAHDNARAAEMLERLTVLDRRRLRLNRIQAQRG